MVINMVFVERFESEGGNMRDFLRIKVEVDTQKALVDEFWWTSVNCKTDGLISNIKVSLSLAMSAGK